ncbi:hypothetical protein OG322_17730 [Streptomyces sp. NBC_01260]|uniref:hypothetical protein n=1 Tax=Streptomyces sp. NBC_01260 TaxID=2903801 RepID=UPI002E330203|nr:hypothetical protein [Streptomyces sp. NBC_01260]
MSQTSFVERASSRGGWHFKCSCGSYGRAVNTPGAAERLRIAHMQRRHGITVNTSRAVRAQRDVWDRIARNR